MGWVVGVTGRKSSRNIGFRLGDKQRKIDISLPVGTETVPRIGINLWACGAAPGLRLYTRRLLLRRKDGEQEGEEKGGVSKQTMGFLAG